MTAPAASTPTKAKPPVKVRRVEPKITDPEERIKQVRKATSRIRTKASIDFVKSVRGR